LPAYTSGHATIGAALFQTLERFYGTSNVRFTFVSDEFNGITRDSRTGQPRPIVSRTFTSFDQAAEENGQSRIYLGIHWAFDKTEGIRSGNRVANFVFNNFLRPNTGAGDGRGSVDTMLEWNEVMIQADAVSHSGGANDQPGPVLAARAFAITSAAMYDAYNSIERIGARYLVNAPNASDANSDAAVAQAAHDVLVALYPSQRVAFDAALTQTLRRIPDGGRETRGRAVGAFVADVILDARANDDADSIQDPPYVPNGQPGFHNVDPLNPGQGFYGPDAGDIDPFAVNSSEQFAPGHLGAQGVGSDRTDLAAFLRTQDYTDAYNEVKRLGGDGVTTPTQRTAEQTTIGIFWGYDGSPGLGTPPRLYNQITRTVAIQENNTEAENVRLFALVNIAMADAAITSWEAKYDEAFWRPILGIRRGGSDGNLDTQGDPNWTPLGAPRSNPFPGEINFTPPFPAYTSGHATIGAALFQTLERFYGTSNVRFTFVSDEFNGITRDSRTGLPRPIVARTFTSFDQASEENGQSRIYLGIHWAFDKTEGIRSGSQVANFVFNNFLRPGF
jgi:hypothetical protein